MLKQDKCFNQMYLLTYKFCTYLEFKLCTHSMMSVFIVRFVRYQQEVFLLSNIL
jgi:hypothetical protein